MKPIITVTTEFDQGAFEFDDAVDNKEMLAKLESGQVDFVYITVKAELDGVVGVDVLGGCFVSSPKDVDSHVKEYSMIENAIEDLNKNLAEKRLRDAAPELLAAAKHAVDVLVNGRNSYDDVLEDLYEAIAKAKGESK